jgi:heptosyltransferase III
MIWSPVNIERRKILVFRTGNLGDTLAVIPALAQIRDHFSSDHITLLCNGGIGTQVVARDVLEGSDLVDDFILYPTVDNLGIARKIITMMRILRMIRAGGFSLVVYLPETRRQPRQINRDRWLFRMAGQRQVLGLGSERPSVRDQVTRPLPVLPREMERLLVSVGQMGIPVLPFQQCRRSLGLGASERKEAEGLLAAVPDSRPLIGVAIGSKMSSKCWPLERYAEVLTRLRQTRQAFPVFVGGREDAELTEEVIAQIGGEGLNLCGRLGIRLSAAVLAHCTMYLGNDTGPMHLAASEDVPCVALFSARDFPGSWYPAGSGHVVLRKALPCEGCMLQVCRDKDNQCMRDIAVEEVITACEVVLSNSASQART